MPRPITFFTPSDLAAARVRIVGPSGKSQLAFTTPGQNFFDLKDTAPGPHVAYIEPLGQFPLTYQFEIGSDDTESVRLPLLAELRASELEKSIFKSAPEEKTASMPAIILDEKSLRWSETPIEEVRKTLEASARPREIAIGLSQARGLFGGWVRCADHIRPRVDVVAGGVDVIFDRTEMLRPDPRGGARLRLSVAIDNSRVTRMLVPLFSGGTRIALRASPLTTADLGARVVPLAPNLRALTQAMESAVSSETETILQDFFKSTGSLEAHFDPEFDYDPWTQSLLALIALRFPSVAAFPSAAVQAWAERTAWMADAHVIAARLILTEAGQRRSHKELLLKATENALDRLKSARDREACYFAYANGLWGDMLTALAGGAPSEEQGRRARQETDARQKSIRLERHAGVCFAWRAVDFPDEDGPYSKGDLINSENASLLFRGRLDLSDIGPATARPEPSSSAINEFVRNAITSVQSLTGGERGLQSIATNAPGSARPVTVPDDPVKGRFGGQASRGGFTLGVTFGQQKGGWVKFVLVVEAGSHRMSASETAEFYLHNTFQPDRVCVRFAGGRAQLPLTAWGGFTVGVWLPERGVELELDLALVDGAPKIIREL